MRKKGKPQEILCQKVCFFLLLLALFSIAVCLHDVCSDGLIVSIQFLTAGAFDLLYQSLLKSVAVSNSSNNTLTV